MRTGYLVFPVMAALLAGAAPAAAQGAFAAETRAFLDGCAAGRDRAGGRQRERHCEVRNFTLPATGELWVHAGAHGGITVRGWDRAEVYLVALVAARAPGPRQAEEVARQVRVEAGGGTVRATGPRPGPWDAWSVELRLMVPRGTALVLDAEHGAVDLAGVEGRIQASSQHGAVRLADVAGDVSARAAHGPVEVVLGGAGWRGERLEVRATHGAVTLRVAPGYSALLEAWTMNGTVETEVPLLVQGRVGRRMTARLGQGGAPVRVYTLDGALRVLPLGADGP